MDKKTKLVTWLCSESATKLLVFALFWMVASASFSGFIGKWGLRDGAERFGVELMLEGSADRPFVYRQLLPVLANTAASLTPPKVKAFVEKSVPVSSTFAKAQSFEKANIKLQYIVIYYLCFAFLFASLFVLRSLLLDLGYAESVAIGAPVIFVLAFPYLQTIGGYFYDGVELFFMASIVLLAIRQKVLPMLLLIIPATLNKETFFFFLPALYPILKIHYERNRTILLLGVMILVSGCLNVVMKSAFSDSAGGVAEFHLLRNLVHYFLPRTYFRREETYGIIGPGGFSLLTLLIVSVVAYRGWLLCGRVIRQHILIAGMINLPLFLAFAAVGELRNLSLMFVGFVALLAGLISSSRIDNAERD